MTAAMKLKDTAPWKKSYDEPRQHIKKQKHYFANKGPYSQTIVFPVVMCGCQSWTTMTAECQRMDTFKLCCWRRLLRVSWAARRSNQSILKIINPEYSLEGLILKDWGQEEKGVREDEMASEIQWTWIWENSGIVKERGAWCVAVHGVAKSRTWLSNWTTTRI